MKCKKCNNKFVKKENCVNRINGTKITVCPECGNEELYDKISSTEKVHKDKINDDFSKIYESTRTIKRRLLCNY